MRANMVYTRLTMGTSLSSVRIYIKSSGRRIRMVVPPLVRVRLDTTLIVRR